MIMMEPWEALDIDDSDLESFLRPCKRRLRDSPPKSSAAAASRSNLHRSSQTLASSQSQYPSPQSTRRRLIPGPAGAVQAAMDRRALTHRSSSEDAADPLPTQEFIRRVVENGDESDYDFNSNAWLSALEFLRREGMADGNRVAFGTPLSSITKHLYIERVVQVLAVVKSCTPNGFGDLMVTLKDPSGTIGASVHRKVFTDGKFGKDVKLGSVLVLQKVAVFSPIRSVCYLNITSRNIVKIFSKDSGPPSELYPTPLRRTAPPIIGINEKLWEPINTLSVPRERTNGIITNLSLTLRFKEKEDVDKRGRDKVSGSKQSDNGIRNQNVISYRENVSPGNELENEMDGQPNHPHKIDGNNPAHGATNAPNNASFTNSIDISESDGPETGMKNLIERNKEILIPKTSIPHWTEEQLDELLAFD